MNNKGFIQDGLYFIIILFVIGIAIVSTYIILTAVNDAFQAQTAYSDSSKQHVDALQSNFPSVFDWAFITVFIGLLLAGVVVSYLVPANPLIFFFMVFIIIIFGALGGFISNSWEDSTQEGALANSADNFPMMSFVFNHYLSATIIVLLLMSVVFYAKPDGGLS